MVGALVVVLFVGASIGFVGRLAVPGWRGSLRHDDELWWELGGGALGALFGYAGGRWFDSYSLLGATPMRWYLTVIGALVLVGIAIASGAIERARWSRKVAAGSAA